MLCYQQTDESCIPDVIKKAKRRSYAEKLTILILSIYNRNYAVLLFAFFFSAQADLMHQH